MSSFQGFQHQSLHHHGTGEFLAGTVPFIVDGVAAGEPVLVAVAPDRRKALEAALGDDAHQVMFADMRTLGSNPVRIMSVWQDFMFAHGGTSTPIRAVGEPVWPGRTTAELAECAQHEALVNVAFDRPEPFRLLCPYDTATLDCQVIEATHRTHPHVVSAGVCRASSAWTDVESMAAPLPYESMPAPPPNALVLQFSSDDLRQVRKVVTGLGARGGLPPAARADLALSAHELVVNSVSHGGGSGTLVGWHDSQSVTVEVQDRGVIADPLAGLRRPTSAQVGGRGLWLAGQLCDLIQIRRSSTGGAVRLHMNVLGPDVGSTGPNGSVGPASDPGRQ